MKNLLLLATFAASSALAFAGPVVKITTPNGETELSYPSNAVCDETVGLGAIQLKNGKTVENGLLGLRHELTLKNGGYVLRRVTFAYAGLARVGAEERIVVDCRVEEIPVGDTALVQTVDASRPALAMLSR